jgi:hypothetical protein
MFAVLLIWIFFLPGFGISDPGFNNKKEAINLNYLIELQIIKFIYRQRKRLESVFLTPKTFANLQKIWDGSGKLYRS